MSYTFNTVTVDPMNLEPSTVKPKLVSVSDQKKVIAKVIAEYRKKLQDGFSIDLYEIAGCVNDKSAPGGIRFRECSGSIGFDECLKGYSYLHSVYVGMKNASGVMYIIAATDE